MDEDDDDQFVDSDVERKVATSRAKAKGKIVVSPKKGKSKGMLIKKPMFKSTGKRKKS